MIIHKEAPAIDDEHKRLLFQNKDEIVFLVQVLRRQLDVERTEHTNTRRELHSFKEAARRLGGTVYSDIEEILFEGLA